MEWLILAGLSIGGQTDILAVVVTTRQRINWNVYSGVNKRYQGYQSGTRSCH